MRAEDNLNNEVSGESAAIGRGKRRRWSEAERRQMVEETLVPGASVARVALAHGVNANQVFGWRSLYRRGLLGPATLLPVKITPPGEPTASVAAHLQGSAGRSGSGTIHITVGKAQIRIEGDVDRETLRVVLKSVLR